MGRHNTQSQNETPQPKKQRSMKLPHPKGVAALAAVSSIVIGGSGFAINNYGNIQAVESNATPENAEAEAAPTMSVTPASEYSDDQVVLSTVDFYKKVCPDLSNLTSVTRNMSIAVEESVGKNEDELAGFWTGQLHSKSKGLHDSANALQHVSNEHGINPTPVTAVTDKAHGIAFAFTEYANSINPSNVTDLSGQARTVAANQGVELSGLVQGVVDAVPFPTTATANAVYDLEECGGVFNTGETVNGPIEAAVDFHNRIDASSKEIDATRSLIDNIEVTNDVDATKNAVADVWLKRAQAAEGAAENMKQWSMPEAPTQAELDVLHNYVKAQQDAIHVWEEFAAVAHKNEQLIRGASDSDSLNEALNVASEDTWHQDVNEEKMLIRVSRTASSGR